MISSSDNRDERYDWPGRRHEESSLLGFATAEVAEGAVVGTVWAAAAAESDMMGKINQNGMQVLFGFRLVSYRQQIN